MTMEQEHADPVVIVPADLAPRAGLRTRQLLNLGSLVLVGMLIVAAIPLWVIPNWSRIFPGPPDRGPHLFVGDGSQITAVAASNGATSWHVPLSYSSFAASTGIVLVQIWDNTLIALDPATGARRWEQAHWRGMKLSTFTAQILDGTIYVQASDGYTTLTLTALDSHIGAILWDTSTALTSIFNIALYAAQRLVLVAYQSYSPQRLEALDARTGAPRWTWRSDQQVWPTIDAITVDMVILDNPLANDFTAQQLMALNLTDGSVRWLQTIHPVGPTTDFAVDATGISVLDYGANHLAQLDSFALADGQRRWSREWDLGTAIHAGGGKLLASDPASQAANGVQAMHPLTALDAQSGTILWQVPGIIGDIDAVSGDSCYIGIYRDVTVPFGHYLGIAIMALNLNDGAPRWTGPPDASTRMFLEGHVVYLVTKQGISALDAQSGKPRWQTRTYISGGVSDVPLQVAFA